MKNYIIIACASLFLLACDATKKTNIPEITTISSTPTAADDGKVSVAFTVQTPKTATTAACFLSGNTAELGNWQPNGLPLQKINDTLWGATVRLPKGAAIEYKTTRGAWETEATDKIGRQLGNSKLRATADTAVQYRVYNWKDGLYLPSGQVTGTVEMMTTVQGEGLKKRKVFVWLPPNYDTETERYAVVYAHDAQNLFDPRTSTGGHDWQLDETADSLIRNKVIAPIIIVAIENTADRSAEYNYGDLGNKYQSYLLNTLKPYIDKHYRTLPDAAHTATFGSSMGGLVSFVLAFERPDVFGHAACFSPAFKIGTLYDGLDYVKTVQASTSKKNIDLYIDNGTLDLEARLQPGIDDMMAELKKQNYPFVWFSDKGATHNEQAWARRTYRPLVQFFPYQPPINRSNRTGIPQR